jgi:hypothetical protein
MKFDSLTLALSRRERGFFVLDLFIFHILFSVPYILPLPRG